MRIFRRSFALILIIAEELTRRTCGVLSRSQRNDAEHHGPRSFRSGQRPNAAGRVRTGAAGNSSLWPLKDALTVGACATGTNIQPRWPKRFSPSLSPCSARLRHRRFDARGRPKLWTESICPPRGPPQMKSTRSGGAAGPAHDASRLSRGGIRRAGPDPASVHAMLPATPGRFTEARRLPQSRRRRPPVPRSRSSGRDRVRRKPRGSSG